MATWFDPLWQYIQNQVGSANIIGIVTAIAFVTSFITYVLATVISRKVYIRLQRRALADVFILFFSLALSITELIEPITVFGIPNFLLKSALVIWTTGLIVLIWLIQDVLSVDRIKFKKPKVLGRIQPFQVIPENPQDPKSVQSFGLGCVDDQFRAATNNGKHIYFPVLLVAEKYFRPWRMAERFAVAGLAFESDEKDSVKEGVIYFAFNQPAKIVVDQLANRISMVNPKAPAEYKKTLDGKAPKKFGQVVVIDCHSKWLEKQSFQSHTKEFPEGREQVHVLFSDPRNPYDLAKKYKLALEILLNMSVKRIRVVYDSISDFLVYSDPQLALQFIKHNMVWEDKSKISSLYVYIPGVPQSGENNPIDENFLRWISYCVIEFKHQEPKSDTVILEGLWEERIARAKVECTPEADYRTVQKTLVSD